MCVCVCVCVCVRLCVFVRVCVPHELRIHPALAKMTSQIMLWTDVKSGK